MANDKTSVKQTAVEWLVKELSYLGYLFAPAFGHAIIEKKIEEAKQIEKKQTLTISSYDLEKLATDAADNYDSSGNWHVAYELYKKGFQKALELLTFKSE